MINRTFVRGMSAMALGAGVLLTGACRNDPLDVVNPNQPEIERAFGAVISKLFHQMFNGLYGVAGDALWAQSLTMSFESSSQLGNFGMGTRSQIPRPLIDNAIGNSNASGNFRVYDHLSRNARQAAAAIARLNQLIAESPVGNATGSAASDERSLSFAFFALGFAHGHLALYHDSAAVLDPSLAAGEIPPLSDYNAVNAAAIRYLDSALAHATSDASAGLGGWPIPTTGLSPWWNTAGQMSLDRTNWQRVIRSHRAKFMAGIGRTPAERDAANWTQILDDAENGIVTDAIVFADSENGWFQTTLNQLAVSTTWSQMTPFILGMGDTSRTGAGVYAYEVWLQMPVASRTPNSTLYPNGTNFLMRTPDLRWPPGETRAAQQVASGGTSRSGPPLPPPGQAAMYFRNRPGGDDVVAWPWGTWFYDNHRFWHIRAEGGKGVFVLMARAENDLLAAEAHLRAGNPGLAVPLINRYRGPAGLPALPAGMSLTDPVPGGTACVPRVPQPPEFTTTACGDIWEALKWEKRSETAFTGYAQWFIDSRGWGDLYAGTPLEWPVPYQELFARDRASYQNTRVAAVGTYGFGRSSTF